MVGRPVVVTWINSADDLCTRAECELNPHLARRWQALHMLRCGKSVSETAETIGVAYRTVEYWLEWYRAGGVFEVLRHRQGRGKNPSTSTPSDAQIEVLLNEARTNGFSSQRAAIAWMAEHHGVTITPSNMSRLFRSARIRRRLPPTAISNLTYYSPSKRSSEPEGKPFVTRVIWRLPMRGDYDYNTRREHVSA